MRRSGLGLGVVGSSPLKRALFYSYRVLGDEFNVLRA